MATKTERRVQKMHPDEILSFVQSHHDPAVTAAEVAEEFDVTPRAARYRLNQLRDEKRVQEKVVGSSAKIYYVLG